MMDQDKRAKSEVVKERVKVRAFQQDGAVVGKKQENISVIADDGMIHISKDQ